LARRKGRFVGAEPKNSFGNFDRLSEGERMHGEDALSGLRVAEGAIGHGGFDDSRANSVDTNFAGAYRWRPLW